MVSVFALQSEVLGFDPGPVQSLFFFFSFAYQENRFSLDLLGLRLKVQVLQSCGNGAYASCV